MLRIIKFLFTGDWHLCEWEPYGKERDAITLFDDEPNVPTKVQPSKCKHCGKIETFRLYYKGTNV